MGVASGCGHEFHDLRYNYVILQFSPSVAFGAN